MAVSPLILKVALWYHVCGTEEGARENYGASKWKTDPVNEAHSVLLDAQLIYFNEICDQHFPTDRMPFWINHILETPFPQIKIYIPDRESLDP